MQSHDNTAKAHIGAESSSTRSSIATRKRALQQAKALRRSEITHFRWSPAFGCLVHQCRQARGGIPLVAISVRACMPGQRIFTSRTGYWYRFFNFDLPEGSQGNTEADWGHWGQTRFGHARSERRRPQFTAHNSVRPFENGLRSLGSSATRPPRKSSFFIEYRGRAVRSNSMTETEH
jgi:hypothetical protein